LVLKQPDPLLSKTAEKCGALNKKAIFAKNVHFFNNEFLF